MRRTALLIVPLAALAGGGFLAGTVHAPRLAAAADPTPTTADSGVVVSGLGRTSGTPDVLRVSLGVQVVRADVSSALRDAARQLDRVRAAVRAHGVDGKDLQTDDVSIYPSYTERGVPNGYSVSETLTVKLRDLSRAGRTIGAAVDAGGDAVRLQGVSFALEDNTALLGKARDAAYADAKAKAERYAELSGRSLGQVELVSEDVPQAVQPVPYARAAAASPSAGAAGTDVPVDPGQSQVSVSVTVRWSLR